MPRPRRTFRHTNDVTQVADDGRQLARELGPGAVSVIRTEQTIGTSSTRIVHGLGYVPTMVSVELQADARWWRAAAPDAEAVYLRASASVKANVEIF